MSTETATLIAAAVAALASVAGLVLNLVAQTRAEVRQANRALLGPHLNDLARSLHEVLASATILSKARTDKSRENWRKRAADAQGRIKGFRSELRYPLWGIHEGLRVISRLPNWLEHTHDLPEVAQELWADGNRLRNALDLAIRDAYVWGRPPSRRRRRRVNYFARRLRTLYAKHTKAADTELDEEDLASPEWQAEGKR